MADMRAAEWMTGEQAAKYLGCESVKAFEKIAARERSPSTTSRPAPLATTALKLDKWLLERRPPLS